MNTPIPLEPIIKNKSIKRLDLIKESDSSAKETTVKFVLVGDGILREEIETLIAKFNLEQQVILTGWRRDIACILSAIDIFVLTSLWEGLPISALEAMAVSLPVVATNTGGISEIVWEGKTGFLVSPGDMNRMADKLKYLLGDEDLRNQIGRNAKDSLGSDFSIENTLKDTETLYQDLIKERFLLF